MRDRDTPPDAALTVLPATPPSVCHVFRLGLVPYLPTWERQQQLAQARRDGTVPDALLLLEHPHTFTLGRRGKPEHILISADEQARLGVGVFEIDRGGDVTYHGPGQLVGYPIVALEGTQRDIRRYMRSLEEVVIRALASFGVAGRRIDGLTGVWVGEEKIAALGVRVAMWVTTHGFALNVDPDLQYFSHIVPCGITDRGVTSLARLLGVAPTMGEVESAVVTAFGAVFAREMIVSRR